jgi:hypothetical protein
MALLPPFFLHTVAAIGVGDDPAKRTWIGTGFLFGNLIDPPPAKDQKTWRVWLITNKHVLDGLRHIYVKFNSAVDPHSKDYLVPLIARNGKAEWIGHPNASTDVAAVSVPVRFLRDEQRLFNYFKSDEHIATRKQLQDGQITEGDRVFVLGFPMGLVDRSRQYVICRGGVIGRIRDYLEGKTADFLVDATVFPGNSGGPVILCPSALAIEGTKTIKKADLIGVVKSYVPYSDLAVSSQTRKPRIMFEENSGLAAVEPVDAILETVALAEKRFKSRLAQAKHKAKKQATQSGPSTTAVPAQSAQASPLPEPAPKEENERAPGVQNAASMRRKAK